MDKTMVVIWVDSSHRPDSGFGTWGAIYKHPETNEKIKLSGSSNGVKNSTHSEILGVFSALLEVSTTHPKISKFEVRIDCLSIVNLFMNPGSNKVKDLAIGRVLNQINRYFGEDLTLVHVYGHSDNKDVSENAVRNREVHQIAITNLRKNAA